ncbi:MAG: hypothetical protein H0U40_09360 [Chloroflexia bacterium]|nr:hypothetical protein [Chloroflexia bacterium]
MGHGRSISATEAWRVVILTNSPGGLIYTLVDAVLRPLGHRVVGVLTSPGPLRRRCTGYLDVVAAMPPGVDVIVSNHPSRWGEMVAPLRPDLIICGEMPWRIPAEVLALPRLGVVYLHPASLPSDRDPAAIDWVVRSEDPEVAFTVHHIVADIASGPDPRQTRPLFGDDGNDLLQATVGPVLPGLLGHAIARVARDHRGEPQDGAGANCADRPGDSWRTIDWARPARMPHDQIRSWTGVPDDPEGGLGASNEGSLLDILTHPPHRDGPDGTASAMPGDASRRDRGGLVVRCGDGSLGFVA